MCACNPAIRTPFCGSPRCKWPDEKQAGARTDVAPPTEKQLGALTEIQLAGVREVEAILANMNQVDIETQHVFHAGMYARTIVIPKDVALTGAYIVIPTLLIVNGHVNIWTGDGVMEVRGYRVLAGSAGRKQVFHAEEQTSVTMVFPTQAKTVDDAEREFTNEADKLLSRSAESANYVLITED